MSATSTTTTCSTSTRSGCTGPAARWQPASTPTTAPCRCATRWAAGRRLSSDPANHYGTLAGVQVVKAVNAFKPLAPTTAEDANDPGTPVVVPAGSTVAFTYAVSNKGNDPLKTVTLVDDAGTIGIMSDDFVPAPVTVTVGQGVFNSGDSNKDGLLDKTETWLYSATHVATAGAYTNVATVGAVNTRTNVKVMDDDPANVFGAVAKIDVEKAINAVDRPDGGRGRRRSSPGAEADPGHAGDLDLPAVQRRQRPVHGEFDPRRCRHAGGRRRTTSRRPRCSAAGFNVGDAQRTTCWMWARCGATPRSPATVLGGAVAQLGLHTNTAAAVGTDMRTAVHADSDTDAASYLGQAARIRIEKAINAVDPTRPTVAEDADTAPGPTLQVGTPITWTYQVFNDGADPIRITSIVDDFGTPAARRTTSRPAAVTVLGGRRVLQHRRHRPGQPARCRRGLALHLRRTSAGGYQAVAGPYRNVAKVRGTGGQRPAPRCRTTTRPTTSARRPRRWSACGWRRPSTRSNPNAPTAVRGCRHADRPDPDGRQYGGLDLPVVQHRQRGGHGLVAARRCGHGRQYGRRLHAGRRYWLPARRSTSATPTATTCSTSTRSGCTAPAARWPPGNTPTTRTVTVRDPVSGATATLESIPPTTTARQAGLQVVKAVNAVKPLAADRGRGREQPDHAGGAGCRHDGGVHLRGEQHRDRPLATVTLVDDDGTVGFTADDFVPTPVTIDGRCKVYNIGDTNKNGLLDKTEIWLYSATQIGRRRRLHQLRHGQRGQHAHQRDA